jgi:hypothetical protein
MLYNTKTFRKSYRYEQELKNNDRRLKYKYETEGNNSKGQNCIVIKYVKL